MCKRLGFAFLPWRLLGLGDLSVENFAHGRTPFSVWHADVTTTHIQCSPQLAFGFVILHFFFLNLSTSFSSLYVPHPGSLTFPGCYIIFSHTNKVALTAPVCWSDLPSLRVNKDEHPSQFWRQNGNPHLLYFFCRETLVRAGHTCRRSHINLYERVVS